ncbi:MAG: DUF6512 family protein [Aquiluna sp.]
MSLIAAVALWMIVPIGIVGSLLHFAFDWSKHNRFVAVFAAVNESYWEHIKIAVWPTFLMHSVLFSVGGFKYPSFLPAATISLYAIPITMVGIVFLYKFFLKRNVLWIDIATFFVVILVSQVIFTSLLVDISPSISTIILSSLFLIALLSAFLVFTLHPPKEPDVFVDPLNLKYGLQAHPDIESDNPQDKS